MWQNIWTPFSLLPILLLWLWPWFLDMVITSPVGHRLGIGHLAASSRILHLHEQLDTLKRISGRLLVASGCGAIIGLERKDADRPAGLRSMTLVSSGSALYTLACIYGIDKGDPARAAAQVCTGVGFIGAGVIAKGSGRDPVRGITTACAVWVSAALGTRAPRPTARRARPRPAPSAAACRAPPASRAPRWAASGGARALAAGTAFSPTHRSRVPCARALRDGRRGRGVWALALRLLRMRPHRDRPARVALV